MWESWILVLARSPTPCVPPRAWGSLPTLGAEAGVWAVGVPASMDAQLKMMPRRSEQELCTEDLPCDKLQGSPPHSSWSGRAYRGPGSTGGWRPGWSSGRGPGSSPGPQQKRPSKCGLHQTQRPLGSRLGAIRG